MEAIGARLAAATRAMRSLSGLNLGANKDSEDRAADFAKVHGPGGARRMVDFATVNVSSPNTEKLRDLQGKRQHFRALLAGVIETREGLRRRVPVFLKIAPGSGPMQRIEPTIAAVALETGIDAVIVPTNTTLSRDGLDAVPGKGRSRAASPGAPLFEKSTRVLAQLFRETSVDGKVPLVGVGGVSARQSPRLCQDLRRCQRRAILYRHGLWRAVAGAVDIARGLDVLLARDGFENSRRKRVGTKREGLAVIVTILALPEGARSPVRALALIWRRAAQIVPDSAAIPRGCTRCG